MLFLSQGVIGDRLSGLGLACAQRLPDYQIVFKLHPGEYARWKTDYPALVEASKLPNVEVVDHNERDLYLLMAESAVQVGVFSTAIYEGLALGCRTVLADLPGIEYMQRLIDAGHATKVADADALVTAIEDSTPAGGLDTNAIFREEIASPIPGLDR